jgi:hypothetical protein
MCNEAREARERGRRNIDIMADAIEALAIPCKFKGVFIDMVANRGLQINERSIGYMEAIGESESDTCLLILEGNRKRAGLIAAYRLATELTDEWERAKVVEWIRDELQKKTIDEKSILLGVSYVRGSRG